MENNAYYKLFNSSPKVLKSKFRISYDLALQIKKFIIIDSMTKSNSVSNDKPSLFVTTSNPFWNLNIILINIASKYLIQPFTKTRVHDERMCALIYIRYMINSHAFIMNTPEKFMLSILSILAFTFALKYFLR